MSSVSIDQQFVEFVVKSIVGNPDAVSVVRSVDEKGVLLELTVDPEDLGRVIGKRGATAQSVRTLLRALGTKNEARYNLKIIDNGVPRPERTDDSMASSSATDDSTTSSSPMADDSMASSVATSNDDAVDKDDVEVPEAIAEKVVPEAPKPSASVSQTRKDLAEFDDLDI